MAQQLCVLGGVQFEINAYPYSNQPKKTSIYTATQGGGVRTIWQPAAGGTFVQDQQINMTWAVMTRAFYLQLATLFDMLGTMTFVDPYAVSWTVVFADLNPVALLKGGDNAIENVQVMLQVVNKL